MRDDLDRFYTKASVARECFDAFDTSLYDLKIEPSAGSGSFSSLTECLAFDLEPQVDNAVKKDWFTVAPYDIPEHKNMLIFGNPPFGKRSTIAKNFIKHSIKLGADTIAFILPKTFSKKTNQSVFPAGWRLVQEIDLSDSNFDLLGQGEIFIPCSFYVWTVKDDVQPGVDLREKSYPRPVEFSFVKRGSEEADFTINGNNGRVKNISEVTNPKAEHYIKVSEGEDIESIKALLSDMNFAFFSSVNGGVSWINQDAISKSWHDKMNPAELTAALP